MAIGATTVDAQLPCGRDTATEDSVYIYRDGHNDEYKLIYRKGEYFFEYTPRPIEILSTDKLKSFKVIMDGAVYENITWYLRKLSGTDEWLVPRKVTGGSSIYLPDRATGYYLDKDAGIKNQTDSIFRWMGQECVPFDINNTRNRSFAGTIITRRFINKGGVVTGYDEYFFKPNPVYAFIRQDESAYYIYVAKGKYTAAALHELAGKELIITAAIREGNIPTPGGRNGPEGRGGIYLFILTIEQMHND